MRERSRVRAAFGGIGIVALLAATLVPSLARSPTSYVVGAKTFAEQYVLSALIAQRMRAAGLTATTREGLGSNVIFGALASDDIDVYVDYSGTLWANQFQRTDVKPRQELLRELGAMLAKQKITLVGELGFENSYALVMPRKRADALGIRTIADLASHAATMSMAADYEFLVAAGMGGPPRGLWPVVPEPATDAARLHVCRRRLGRSRRDRGLHQRRFDCEV